MFILARVKKDYGFRGIVSRETGRDLPLLSLHELSPSDRTLTVPFRLHFVILTHRRSRAVSEESSHWICKL